MARSVVPTFLTAGDTTAHRLGAFDINESSTAVADWHPCQYVNDYDLQTDNAVMNDATVYGDGGFTGQDKTGTAWQLTVTLNHMIVPGTVAYHETHNYLESHGVGQLGAANRVQLRMYDFDTNDPNGLLTPIGQAYMGFANYSWPGYGAGKVTDPRMVAITFMGKGKLFPIAHPYPLNAAAPTLYTSDGTSYAAAGGTPFRLTGTGFTGTTGVTIGGTAVTSFKVWNDGEITGVAAAHAAASGLAIIVTNAAGASSGGPTATYV